MTHAMITAIPAKIPVAPSSHIIAAKQASPVYPSQATHQVPKQALAPRPTIVPGTLVDLASSTARSHPSIPASASATSAGGHTGGQQSALGLDSDQMDRSPPDDDDAYYDDGPSMDGDGEKPRIRAEGPGGADVKRGARIACLECRAAKIRCSAPNDGKVPCKRCARHEKDCVFEKHRRGRKPGRPNLPKERANNANEEGSQRDHGPPPMASPGHEGMRHPNDGYDTNRRPQSWMPPMGTGTMASSHSMPHLPGAHMYPHGPAAVTGPSGHHDYYSRTPAASSSHHARSHQAPVDSATRPRDDGHGMQMPEGSSHYGPGRPAFARGPHSAHPGPIPHFPAHDPSQVLSHRPQMSSQSPRYEGSASQPSYTHRGPLTTSATPRQHGFFSPPLSRAEGGAKLSEPRPSPSYSPRYEPFSSRWGPVDRSSNGNRLHTAGVPSMDSTQRTETSNVPSSSSSSSHIGGAKPSYVSESSGYRSMPSAGFNATSPSHRRNVLPPLHHRHSTQRSNATGKSSDEDGEEDELVDEDDVGGAHHDTDVLSRPLQLLAYASTAAARKQAHGGFRDRRSVTAAASLGLISAPPPPPSSLYRPLRVQSDREIADNPRAQQNHAMISAGIQGGGGAEPSTLENGNWEYKAGRVRAIKGSVSSEGPIRGQDKQTEVASASNVAGGQAALHSLAHATAAGLKEPLDDEGPHLGKRRRSDDEPLPIPRSRKGSQFGPIQSLNAPELPLDAHGAVSEDDETREATKDELTRATTPVVGLPAGQRLSASTDDDTSAHCAPQDAIGASRKGYFRFSLYSSKLDVDPKDDPITSNVVSLQDMEHLFDFFFNKINAVNFVFDPFLHSMAYVRARSKFLLTVIASIAARMRSDAGSAELAEKLEDHWKNKLFPQIIIGGYKSVEISQGFLLASLFHRPTHIIVEDRAWQYLGMAIRTATEVGVNIALTPSSNSRDNEQLSRRVRNRQRLWKSLLIAEGTLSTQFGRPSTLSCQKSPLPQSLYWNREDFALPEDAALVAQIELRKVVERHIDLLDECQQSQQPDGVSESTAAHALRRLTELRTQACASLEAWRQTWCPTGGLDQAGVGRSMAMGAFLVRWSPYSRLIYNYWRCHLNSVMLQAISQKEDLSTSIAFDSMQCARELMSILLDEGEIGEKGLPLAPNAIIVMATYAAVSALRLTKLDLSRLAFIDARTIFEQVHKLADALEVAGKTPAHRDGAAGPYGTYLRSVLALFDNDSKSSSSVASHALIEDSKVAPLSGREAAATTSDPSDAGVTTATDRELEPSNGAGTSAKSVPNAPSGLPATGTLVAQATDRSAAVEVISTNKALPADPSNESSSTSASASASTLATPGAAASTAAEDGDEAVLSSMYSSDPEVWEYFGAVGPGGTAEGPSSSSAAAAAAAALWPSTSTTSFIS